MIRKDMMARMDANELMEWSLYFKLKAEQEQQAALSSKAQNKLNNRERGGLRRGRHR